VKARLAWQARENDKVAAFQFIGVSLWACMCAVKAGPAFLFLLHRWHRQSLCPRTSRMHLHPSALPDSWRWGMRKGGCTFSRRGATSWLSMTQVCMYAHVCVRLCVCVCVLAWARVCMQSLVCQWHRRMHARHVR